MQAPELGEASGLAASRRQPDVLWTHNDSGDVPRLFALSTAGELIATFAVTGAEAVDWEEVGIGPGASADRDALYIADTGDNLEARRHVVVYRVPEPTVDATQRGGSAVTAPAQRLELTYPDRPHDAEALLVDPQSDTLLIVTKERGGPTLVFAVERAAFARGSAKLQRVGEVRLPGTPFLGGQLVTSGSISPDGGRVLLKTYSSTFLWTRAAGPLVMAFAGPRCEVPIAFEPQGEAIAFLGGGARYVTLSEGLQQPLYFFTERAP